MSTQTHVNISSTAIMNTAMDYWAGPATQDAIDYSKVIERQIHTSIEPVKVAAIQAANSFLKENYVEVHKAVQFIHQHLPHSVNASTLLACITYYNSLPPEELTEILL